MTEQLENQSLLEESPATDAPPSTSRRDLVRSLIGGAAVVGAASAAKAQDLVADDDPLFVLVNRINQGFTLAEYQRARLVGFDSYLKYHLDYTNIDDSVCDAQLAQYTTLDQSAADLRMNYPPGSGMQNIPRTERKDATVVSSYCSDRGLFERMVEFWTDHLSVDSNDGQMRWFLNPYIKDVIRANALGNVKKMVKESAHSAGMLYYLDNNANIVGSPQENYARELMELHTIGEGNFSEMDVEEVARCFTGWTYYGTGQPTLYGTFRFINGNHDQGQKVVLGNIIPPNGGQSDGEKVLDILLDSKEAAKYISSQMIIWLLGYNPGDDLIDKVAGVYDSTGGDIPAMIQAILTPENFDKAAVYKIDNKRLRRPFTYVSAILRASAATMTDPRFVRQRLGNMGMEPHTWPAPNGFPDSLGAWGSDVLGRWDFCADLMDNNIPGVTTSLTDFFAQVGGMNPARIVAQINSIFMRGLMTRAEVETLNRFLTANPGMSISHILETIALAGSTVSVQMH